MTRDDMVNELTCILMTASGDSDQCDFEDMAEEVVSYILRDKVEIDYTNHQGERAIRTISPWRVNYGATEYHPKEGWLIGGFDHDKQACRAYSLNDIHSWNGKPVPTMIKIEPLEDTSVEAALNGLTYLAGITEKDLYGGLDSAPSKVVAFSETIRQALRYKNNA